MSTVVPNQCAACRRRRQDGVSCDAYPGGIPDAIMYGGDHREAHPGDRGLRFLQLNTAAARGAFEEWHRTFGE